MKPGEQERYELMLVMPLGSACRPDYIIDSLNSFRDYTRCRHKIVLADDSQKGTGRLVSACIHDVDVIETGRPMGKSGGLYLTLCMAYRYVLEHYRFNVLLRMDTDALVIGPEPEVEAEELFRTFPHIGLAGAVSQRVQRRALGYFLAAAADAVLCRQTAS